MAPHVRMRGPAPARHCPARASRWSAAHGVVLHARQAPQLAPLGGWGLTRVHLYNNSRRAPCRVATPARDHHELPAGVELGQPGLITLVESPSQAPTALAALAPPGVLVLPPQTGAGSAVADALAATFTPALAPASQVVALVEAVAAAATATQPVLTQPAPLPQATDAPRQPGPPRPTRAPTAIASFDESQDIRTAAVPEPPSAARKGDAPRGVRWRAAAACVSVGLAARFLLPIPEGVAPQAWTLLSVFLTTIAGLILEPMPVSAWSLCCVTALLVTKATTFQTAMSGLTNEAIWLIVFAFFFAKAFEKTGLGERVANLFISWAGRSSLGMAYGLAVAEALVAPAMPSCTARAGGIFMPVISFLAKSQGSQPRTASRHRLGTFLVHSQMQVSANVAALFMTGAAQNLLAVNIARAMGVVVPDVWVTWALGAIVPGLVSVAMIPALMYAMHPPEVKHTPEAPAQARARLAAMGPLSRDETITLATLAGAVVCWVLGDHLGCSAVLGAMLALCSLLVTGVLQWRDCLEYTPAWDTLMWFAVLMSMCSALSDSGLVSRMADAVHTQLAAASLPPMACFGLLHAIFFWSHYIFASQVGHVGALYGAFLAMMLASEVPATLAALTLGYSANLFGSLTHFASGPAAVFHASGYTRLGEVMKAGLLMGLRSWLVWGVVGMAWWKVLGWW